MNKITVTLTFEYDAEDGFNDNLRHPLAKYVESGRGAIVTDPVAYVQDRIKKLHRPSVDAQFNFHSF